MMPSCTVGMYLRHVVLDGFDHDAVLKMRRATGHLHAPRRRHELVRHIAIATDFIAAWRST